VPNSLSTAELLLHCGTKVQKNTFCRVSSKELIFLHSLLLRHGRAQMQLQYLIISATGRYFVADVSDVGDLETFLWQRISKVK